MSWWKIWNQLDLNGLSRKVQRRPGSLNMQCFVILRRLMGIAMFPDTQTGMNH
eukprot:CCRYP_004632-RA/>CCRYP_004632-RA protein AED:0.32 eAED:0.58 QI:0/-1/0/1/-1/0/1/0/52